MAACFDFSLYFLRLRSRWRQLIFFSVYVTVNTGASSTPELIMI